jgi:hypothetical protein
VSDSITTSARPSSARASARLGLTLRAVLLSPDVGLESALRATGRRERAQQRPAEGFTPYLLAAVGGAASLLLWLKLGGLLGWREAPEESFRGVYLVLAVSTGAVLGLGAQAAWSYAAPAIAGGVRRMSRRDGRLVWGVACLPQVGALVVLLPLDLMIVGPESYTSGGLADTVAAGWAAASIALAVGLAGWSLYLTVRGAAVAARTSALRAALSGAISLVVLVLVFGVPIVYPAVFP